MKKYEFNCGVVVGRFSPLHVGHEKLITTALKKCRKVVVIVTSNNKIDKKNPYSLDNRIYLINKVFFNEINSGRIKIATYISKNKIDLNYGANILQIVKDVAKVEADYIIYGNDKNIEKCFSKEAIAKLYKVIVDRKEVNVCATDIRKAIKNNDIKFLENYLNPLVLEEFQTLSKKELLFRKMIDK